MSSTVPVQAAAAASFVQSIGVNTHVDFSWTAYDNLAAVQDALFYLGVKNVRDAIDNPVDLAKFTALNANLGVKFDFFIAPGSAGLDWQLAMIKSNPAIVRFVEGANESDNWPQSYAGLTGLEATAAEQRALCAAVKSAMPGVGVIGPSFGWLESYAQAGDLAPYADYANAHVYFGSGNQPGADGWISTMFGLAGLVAPGRPVATTETGYYTSSNLADPHGVAPMVQAKYILNDLMDQFSAGAAAQYLYELVDQRPDPGNSDPQLHFGLFRSNWAPKPAATAVHNLLQLLHDPGVPGFAPGTLAYSLTGMPATADSLLLEKSDGTFVLALWNDVRLSGPATGAVIKVPPVPVTLTLAERAAKIDFFNPLVGTDIIREVSNVRRLTLNLLDHPILVEIGPHAGAPIAQSDAAPPPLVPVPAAPTGVNVTAPEGIASLAGQDQAVPGVTVVDPWAAGIAANMAITISAARGTLAMGDDGGNPVPGSGTGTITLNANLFQINTDLAHLSYRAEFAGNDTITVDVWDPAGLEAMATIAVTTAADSLASFDIGDAVAADMPLDLAGDLLPVLATAPSGLPTDGLAGSGSADAAQVGLMAWFLPAPGTHTPTHFWPN